MIHQSKPCQPLVFGEVRNVFYMITCSKIEKKIVARESAMKMWKKSISEKMRTSRENQNCAKSKRWHPCFLCMFGNAKLSTFTRCFQIFQIRGVKFKKITFSTKNFENRRIDDFRDFWSKMLFCLFWSQIFTLFLLHF